MLGKHMIGMLAGWACSAAFAAENLTFPLSVSDFSARYAAVIEENPQAGAANDGKSAAYVIKVYEKAGQKVLIRAFTSDVPAYLQNADGQALANIRELPYGAQSVLQYDDVDFDGKKDVILMNGNNSCYSGPSFDVYLAQGGGFRYSEAFSALGNDYCGMFQIDAAHRTLYTMSKSGCCYHEYSLFKVANKRPVLIERNSESLSAAPPGLFDLSTETWQNGKHRQQTRQVLSNEVLTADDTVSFRLADSGKTAVLFHSDGYLYYALLRGDDVNSVEFYYPQPVFDQEIQDYVYGEFHYNARANTLRFRHKAARYELYQTPRGIGIRVTVGGKTHDLRGEPTSVRGTLAMYGKSALPNVIQDALSAAQ